MWILLLILVLIVLSVLFGGFQKGSKVNGMDVVGISCRCDASYG
jgi:hypothetical protein